MLVVVSYPRSLISGHSVFVTLACPSKDIQRHGYIQEIEITENFVGNYYITIVLYGYNHAQKCYL